MPIKFHCTCGKHFSVADEHAGKRTKCPSCGVGLTIPECVSVPTTDSLSPSPFPADLFDELPAASTLASPTTSQGMLQRSVPVRRSSGLGLFVLGLGFHYAGMVVLLLSMSASWMGVALFVGGQGTGIPPEYLQWILAGLCIAGGVLAIVATFIESPACALCLTVPDTATRAFFAGSLLLRATSGVAAVGMLVGNPTQMACASLVAAALSWCLWMFGLRQSAIYLGDENLANEGPRLLLSGFLKYVLALVTLFALVYFGVALQQLPSLMAQMFFLITLPGIVFILSWGIAVLAGLETWEVLLYPTGITFFPSYLDLISTLRRKAQRLQTQRGP
jgi:hypothetical protein